MPEREPMPGFELVKDLAELDRELAEKVEEPAGPLTRRSKAPKQRA